MAVEYAVNSLDWIVLFGLSTFHYGLAITLSNAHPKLLGWLAVAPGTGTFIVGLVQVFNGRGLGWEIPMWWRRTFGVGDGLGVRDGTVHMAQRPDTALERTSMSIKRVATMPRSVSMPDGCIRLYEAWRETRHDDGLIWSQSWGRPTADMVYYGLQS
jgi:hypothetical protein